MIFIKGIREVYGLIGDPVKHSISPIIHNTFFKDRKENKVYTTFLVHKDYENDLFLKEALDKLFLKKIKGINITIPYKQKIIKHLIGIDENAKRIGSINTLKYTEKGYIGYNTDIIGMEDTLIERGICLKDKNVLILGAGGSGYTASFMAFKNDAKSITIANRTLSNAIKLKENISKFYDKDIELISLDDIYNIKIIPDIIINTTTLGFGQNINKSPLEDKFFKKFHIEFVFDIIYTPFETKLLSIAKNNNINYTNGFSMLIYQALSAEEIWIEEKISIGYKKEFKYKILKKFFDIDII